MPQRSQAPRRPQHNGRRRTGCVCVSDTSTGVGSRKGTKGGRRRHQQHDAVAARAARRHSGQKSMLGAGRGPLVDASRGRNVRRRKGTDFCNANTAAARVQGMRQQARTQAAPPLLFALGMASSPQHCEEKSPSRQPSASLSKWLVALVAGGVAAPLVCAPLDVVRTRMQGLCCAPRSLAGALRTDA